MLQSDLERAVGCIVPESFSSFLYLHFLNQNMTTNGNNVLVLYKIVNSDCDAHDPLFNAFSMPFTSKGATLASVKQ